MFTRESRSRIDTLIGKGARINGDVEFVGGLHLDGQVLGSVRSDGAKDSTLTVSQGGYVEGPVEAATVLLDGSVKGDIRARERVVLGATARVEGDVYYGIIEMAVGAQIIGRLVRLAGEVPAAPAT
jgi:cytoskeletal protein CcmA (bactofilin family)